MGVVKSFACVIVSVSGGASTQDAEPLRAERLDNGLRIVVIEDRSAPLVSVQLWFATGSAADNPERPGVAVLARQALQNRGNVAARLRADGALCTSRTTYDTASFAITCRDEQIDAALEAQYDRLARPEFERADYERAVVAVDEATASELVDFAGGEEDVIERGGSDRLAALRAALFPGQPYAKSADFVSRAAIDQASETEMTTFAERWFVAGNATLFVMGDVVAAECVERVRGRFAALPWKEPPVRPQYPSADTELVRRDSTEGVEAGIDWGWCVMPWGYADNAAMDVLCRVMMDPVDGPLRARLSASGLPMPRFRREAWRDDGLLAASFDAPRGEHGAIEAAVNDALKQVAESGPTAVQLNRARRGVVRGIEHRRDDFVRRVVRKAAQEIIGGDNMLDEFEPSVVAHVSRGAVQRAAGMLLERRRTVVTRGLEKSRETAEGDAGRSVEWLDGDAALARLARLAGLRRPLIGGMKKPETAPNARDSGERDEDALPAATQPSPAGGDLLRIDMIGGVNVAGYSTRVLETLLLAGTESHSGELLADYLSYHSIDVRVIDSAGGGAAWIVDAPFDERDRAIGVIEEIARRPSLDDRALIDARRRRLERVRVYADHPREMADFLARYVWEQGDPTEIPTVEALRDAAQALRAHSRVDVVELDRGAPAEPTTQSASYGRSGDSRVETATQPESSRAAAASRVLWLPSESGLIELRCIVPAALLSRGFRDDPHTAGWLLGAVHDAAVEIDGVARWRWRAHVGVGRVVVEASVAEGDVCTVLEALQRRIVDVAADRIIASELATAAALSATTRRLAGKEREMERGFAKLAAAGLGTATGRQYSAIAYVVVGGSERLAHDLSKLGEVRRIVVPAK